MSSYISDNSNLYFCEHEQIPSATAHTLYQAINVSVVCNPAYLVPVPSHDKFGRVAAGRASGVKLRG